MTERRRRPFLPAPRQASATESRRPPAWLVQTWPGRVLSAALVLVLLRWAGLPLPTGLDVLDNLVLCGFAVWGAVRLARAATRRLLWRIRTKLILSYLFIAVVPVLLLTVFFLLVGVLGMSLVTSYMVAVHVERDAQALELLARTTMTELEAAHGGRPEVALAAHMASLRAVHPSLSYAWVRDGRPVAMEGSAPTERPAWVETEGFAGGVQAGKRRCLRGLWSSGRSFLVLDVPLDQRLFAEVEQRTGVRVLWAPGREDGTSGLAALEELDRRVDAATTQAGGGGLNSVAFIPLRKWDTGERRLEPVALRFEPRALLARLSPSSLDLPYFLVTALAAVGGSFLILYSGALVLGLLLARSVTRSVHALTQGTERLRQGDFSRPIPIQSRDQLGDLAESFNMMARGLQDLMRESAEKERLEEELRIARQIQMSLLPQDAVGLPGLRVSALCLPAAEVGGDYYDLLPLAEARMGVLVADVSGKGTSAALYMAELKGLVLSLSRIHDSPARLLADANRILAGTRDHRSFITMTYAVVDVAARTLRYARAGHNPLLHFQAAAGRTRVLAPAGLGLGMDPGQRFEQVLQEETVPLASGDLFLFFTDGISEAMNGQSELFGEARLAALLEQAAPRDGQEDLDALRNHILDEIRAFVGEAMPHDDMTLVLLKVA